MRSEGNGHGQRHICPGRTLIYHTHPFSEAVAVLEGEALFSVEGRTYRLRPLDCIHVPAGVAHESVNASTTAPLVVLTAFACSQPRRNLVSNQFVKKDRTNRDLDYVDPEYIARFGKTGSYELASGTEFCDLFASRYGSVGICGGYGKFQPGTSLPCHTHDYDESITIIEGEATCEVAGRQYRLSRCDTAFVPQGKPHRFLNESDLPMAMIWVYAGSEPSRSVVDVECCIGTDLR